MAWHEACPLAELPPGERRAVTIAGKSIGLYNVAGQVFAIRDACPHKGASLCSGTVSGTMLPSRPHEYVYGMPGHVVRCPWHGWEFDLSTGASLFDAERTVRTFEVDVTDDTIFVEV
jgi:nitrite reductase (NADH) small subunit